MHAIFSLIVTAVLVLAVVGLGAVTGFIPTIEPDKWQCTQSRVVKDTLPREEECTQFTKKEGK